MPQARPSAVTPGQFATFGELLRFLRRREGLTQRELSIAVGYSESQISRLEQNARAPDRASLAARFVPALHMDHQPEWVARLMELGGAVHTTGEQAAVSPAATPPNNLPLQLTSFIGREQELADLKRLLTGASPSGPARLVTLTGHGGCGKTRLALQAANDLLCCFPDGVWFVELAPLADATLVSQAVVTVLGLTKNTGPLARATLTETLRDQHTLLILDNCEHVIDAAAHLVEGILHGCPHVRILATSREMLGTGGETSLYVRSLDTPEAGSHPNVEAGLQYGAVRLFVERAQSVIPNFTLTPENVADVVQICQRLDGIPLAIELAAARLRMLSVEQIASRLDNAFLLLTGGRRTALPRHQTLQALIDWSYDLLTVPEHTLFRRLAVFSGGWTLVAAETVCSGDGLERSGVFELLSHLIDKSLVLVMTQTKGQELRYRFLDTIRQYAMTRLAASGEAETLRQKHAEYYFTLAGVGAPDAPAEDTHFDWLERLETEQDNLRAALAWSLSTLDNAEAVIETWQGGDIWTSAWALNRLGWMAREHGDLEIARTRLEASLHAYREIGNALGIAWTAITLGEVLASQGETAAASTVLQEGLELARQQNEVHAIGWGLNHLGHVAQLERDWQRADELHTESLQVFQSQNYVSGLGWAYLGLGETALAQEDLKRAREMYKEVLLIAREMKEGIGLAWGLKGLGNIAALEQNLAQAVWFWGAGEAFRLALQVRPAPASDMTYERLLVTVRARLDSAEFESIWTAGATAPRDQVTAQATQFLHYSD